MKPFIIFIAMFLSIYSFAHEGHGEAPIEAAKYGGILGNVVSETKMQRKEQHNPPLMRGEIVRSEDGTVRLYLYDLKMIQIKLDGLSKEAKGFIENSKTKTKEQFTLQAHGDHYMGKAPKQKKRPFNIYVSFSRNADKFFVAFDNLD